MTTKRWTDEMLDKLADKLDDLADSIKEGKAMTDALLQIATLHQRKMDALEDTTRIHEKEIELTKQRQAENDARFNVLLEEIRYLIRHKDN